MRTKKYFTVKGFNQQGECVYFGEWLYKKIAKKHYENLFECVYKVITEMDSTTLTEKELACNY